MNNPKMKKPSIMDNKSSPNRNPWINLPTITSFDKGPNIFCTKFNKEHKRKKSTKAVVRNSFSNIFINSLISQFCKFTEKDSTQRKKLQCFLSDTVHKMNLFDPFHEFEGFENIKGKYMNAVCQLLNVAKSIAGNETSIARSLASTSSQYKDQFIEKCLIAEGGFGRVFKAVHKLDEVEYAIKKIIIKLGKVDSIMSHLEEVKTLAKLNHENIVSYKQAWIEPCYTAHDSHLELIEHSENTELFQNISIKNKFPINADYSIDHSNHLSTSCKYSNSNCKKLSQNSLDFSSGIIFVKENEISDAESDSSDKYAEEKSSKSSDSSSDIIFLKENETSDVDSDKRNSDSSSEIIISKENETIKKDAVKNIKITSKTSSDESSSTGDFSEEHRVCKYSTSKGQFVTLFIQMTLCEKTLRHYLDERNLKPTPMHIVNSIIQQILSGLNYIHSKKIVHHDIKPSNIFISTSGKLQVQLGDFGLACPLQRGSHKFAIGTSKYAAPEQLQGECTSKSDMYSLGIVLLEILVPMKTTMEHIEMVKSFKTGKIPSSLSTMHPKWTSILRQLIQTNPTKRPSAEELIKDVIENKYLNFIQHEYYILQTKYNELEDKIEKKNQTIAELKKEIFNLKNHNKNDPLNIT